MGLWTAECGHDDCSGCNLTNDGNPTRLFCPHSSHEIVRASMCREAGDGAFSMSNRADVSWRAHVRPTLVQRQTENGKLICGICKKDIGVDANGKISYTSISQTVHVEYPPIDHYNKDWADRRADLEATAAFQRADLVRQHDMLMDEFNRDPLRITCKTCNLTR